MNALKEEYGVRILKSVVSVEMELKILENNVTLKMAVLLTVNVQAIMFIMLSWISAVYVEMELKIMEKNVIIVFTVIVNINVYAFNPMNIKSLMAVSSLFDDSNDFKKFY